MASWLRKKASRAYERVLLHEINGTPTHVAIIQDGNRRYARQHGESVSTGHRKGAKTTENVLEWCDELGIEELTVYAFSTENFNRDPDERAALFELLKEKLYEFADADRVHESEVCIRALGAIHRLPDAVQDAVHYAERRTQTYDTFRLNIALAYGGRAELLGAARDVTQAVARGDLSPAEIDVADIEHRLYDRPVRDVDLIIRTGGDERTSNFLPWHANGNEAAVFFCAPYWPEFSKIDFLRAIRTYESREASWQRTRAERAAALVRAVAGMEIEEARTVAGRLRDQLPRSEQDVVPEPDVEFEPAD